MMSDLRSRALEFVAKRSTRELKERDQHFMISKKEIEIIVDLAEISEKDVVLEIGAGLGFLTEEIVSRKPKEVYAVEKDPELASILRRRFEGEKSVKVICRDILELLPFKDKYTKVVANPPFSISSRILLGLLESDFKLASMTFQHEFAQRLVSKEGSSQYGSLSVLTSLRFEVELVKKVSRNCFVPKPDVDVALVRLRSRDLPMEEGDWRLLMEMLPHLFERRKRKLCNALEDFLVWKGVNRSLARGFAKELGDERVYKITPMEFAKLAAKVRAFLSRPS